MKTHNPHTLHEAIWRELWAILLASTPTEIIRLGEDQREECINDPVQIKHFQMNHACDSLFPDYLQTDGDGLKIVGTYGTLPHAEEFNIEIILQRPNFNSVESISVKKLAKAALVEFSINTRRNESKLVLS